MRYRINHETAYAYQSEVAHAHHLLHLVPRPAPYQQCLEHSIRIGPVEFRRRDEFDAFANPVTRVEIGMPHRQLEVVTEMLVDVYPRPMLGVADSSSWESCRDTLTYVGRWPSAETLEACRFRHESPHVRVKQLFVEYSAAAFLPGQALLVCAQTLMSKLHGDLAYVPGATSITTAATEVLERRRGVCQDFAHVMIACLRSRGLAARYVSGYLRSVSSANHDRPRLVGHDASHAWVAVYAPPFGWVELDPTNDCFVGIDHVAIAWGRDFGDVSPLRGVIVGGGAHELEVKVSVSPVTPS